MAIHSYVDMSTAHVTQKDMDLLLDGMETQEITKCPGIFAYSYPKGSFVVVPAKEDLFEASEKALDHGFSESFCKALDYASTQGSFILRLDADGDLIDDPALDWPEKQQQKIIETGDGWEACNFAKNFPCKADIQALQQVVIERGDAFDAWTFSCVPGADIFALYEAAEKRGFPGLTEEQAQMFTDVRDEAQKAEEEEGPSPR